MALDHSLFITESEPRFRIVEAARKIFAEYGYEQASISKICEAAGVNRAMVSYYHGGKPALYRDIIDSASAEHLRALREGVYNVEGPLERLRVFIEINISYFDSEPELRSIFDREIGSNFNRAGDIMGNYFIQIIAVLTDVIQQGVDSGCFDEAVAPINIALLVIGALNMQNTLNSFAKRMRLDKQKDYSEESIDVDQAYDFILNGISSKKN